MSRQIVSRDAIRATLQAAGFPPILDAPDCAQLLRISVKTLYQWKALGRLDGTFKKRGKHLLFWRDRVIDQILNGPEWKHDEK